MTDEPTIGPFFTGRSGSSDGRPTVFAALKVAHGAQTVGPNLPAKTRRKGRMETLADSICAGIEKRLPTGPGIVSDTIAAATVFVSTIIHITKPSGAFEM